ncbi:MAG: hypothetical protein AAF939_22310, partial [Planctomycetota bacterium]
LFSFAPLFAVSGLVESDQNGWGAFVEHLINNVVGNFHRHIDKNSESSRVVVPAEPSTRERLF